MPINRHLLAGFENIRTGSESITIFMVSSSKIRLCLNSEREDFKIEIGEKKVKSGFSFGGKSANI